MPRFFFCWGHGLRVFQDVEVFFFVDFTSLVTPTHLVNPQYSSFPILKVSSIQPATFRLQPVRHVHNVALGNEAGEVTEHILLPKASLKLLDAAEDPWGYHSPIIYPYYNGWLIVEHPISGYFSGNLSLSLSLAMCVYIYIYTRNAWAGLCPSVAA